MDTTELEREGNNVTFQGVDIAFTPHDETALQDLIGGDTSTRRIDGVDLVWKDLCFSVPVKTKAADEKKPADDADDAENHDIEAGPEPAPKEDVDSHRRQILHSMSGYVRAGTMLAVMGSSGAGKTSLLNLLAGRLSTSKGAIATGEVLVNGSPRDYLSFRKLAAYVLQDDNMFGELSVEEQLTYTALLRLPREMPREKKLLRVNRVIQELGLSKVRDTLIGNEFMRGVSGGERKRVNIGTELVTDPSLLFLDEPTSGLDSFNALNVMSTLRHLASNGRTVVSTIHQPRSSIFALFDQLCLLSEGRVMYFGPAKDAVAYFSGLRFRSPPHFNPADFFLDLLSIDPRSAELEGRTLKRVEYLGDKYTERSMSDVSTTTVESAPPDAPAEDAAAAAAEAGTGENGHDAVRLRDKEYQSTWINEFSVLSNRAVRLAFREKAANGARFGQTVFFAVLLGIIWLSNGRDESRRAGESLMGILFFLVINQAFGGAFSVIFTYPLEKAVVTRERAANTYRTSSYFLSKAVTDMPKTFLFNSIFLVILYWMVGFRNSAGAFFTMLLVVFLTSFLAESLAIAVSVMAGDAQASAALIPVFVIIAVLFGGFFINEEDVDGWLSWMKYLSFVFYAFNATVKNEFKGHQHEEEFLERMNGLSIWENVAALAGLLVVFRLLGYLLLHYVRGPKYLKF